MLKKIEITGSFPMSAYFNCDIDLHVFGQLMRMIKKTSCVAIDATCSACAFNSWCTYYKISGKHFTTYPGILIKRTLFDKNVFLKGEQKTFVFYCIGIMGSYSDYIKLLFENYLDNVMLDQVFYLENIKEYTLEDNLSFSKKIKVQTIIEKEFISSYNEMVKYYNLEYNTSFDHIENDEMIVQYMKTSLPLTPVGTKKIRPKGIIGSMQCNEKIPISNCIKEIGVGVYNFIGGGAFETED